MLEEGRSAPLHAAGRSWPQIAKVLGCGVGTAYRAHLQLSKNLLPETLSTNAVSAQAAAA